MNHKIINGVHFLKLEGDYITRGRLHASILKQQIQKGAIPALAKKNEWLLRRAGGPLDFKPLQNLALSLYHNVLVKKMEKSLNPRDRKLLHAMAEAAEIGHETLVRAMFQPDGLMLMSRLTLMRYLFKDLPARELPGCSSAAVMKNWTADQKLYVLRNQDYPVVGPWETNTTVMFNYPTEAGEIPYVSIASAGLHTGGLTSMNFEGMTVATHAHFGKDVQLNGQPIFVVGGEIICKAKTIAQAFDIAKKTPRNANWSLVVTSGKERATAVIEMGPNETYIRYPEDNFIAHTNFFHTPNLKQKEALICGGRHDDDYARICRMKQILTEDKGQLTPGHLAKVMGDHLDPWSGEERVLGNTVSVMSTIKSVVFSPEDLKLWVSSRQESPTGLGKFLEIDTSNFWQKDSAEENWPYLQGNRPSTPGLVKDIANYRRAYQIWHMQSHTSDYKERTLEALKHTLLEGCHDPHVETQAGHVAFKLGMFDQALIHFEKSTQGKMTEHLSAVRDLFLARCLDIQNQRDRAREIYAKWATYREERLAREMRRGLKRPYNKSGVKKVMLDLQFVDPLVY